MTEKQCQNGRKVEDFFSSSCGSATTPLKIPSKRNRAISLSDIIAATIGEEARSCDTPINCETTDTDFDFLSSILGEEPKSADHVNTKQRCNFFQGHGGQSNSNQSVSEHGRYSCTEQQIVTDSVTSNKNGDGTKENTCARTTNHSSVFESAFDGPCFNGLSAQEDSNNACDMFNKLQPGEKTQQSRGEPCEDFGSGLITNLGFDTELDGILSPLRPTADQNTANMTQYITKDIGDKFVSPSIPSDDSDLEDSMHFVDPDDTSVHKTNTEDHQQESSLEPEAKRPKISPELKTPRINIQNYINDCNPQFLAFLTSNEDFVPDLPPCSRNNRSRSFSGKPRLSRQKAQLSLNNGSTGLQRTRSFSEAYMPSRQNLSHRKFNTSSSSLLEHPDDSLSNNPFFEDLKSTLLSDCSMQDCPQTLLETLSDGQKQDVYARERLLQARFSALQSKYPTEISELSTFYQQQSSEVETERLTEIHGENMPKSFRNHLNQFYDNQLHTIMERVEKSLLLLSSTKHDVLNIAKTFKARPLLSKRAVNMMEEWYQRNFEHPYPSSTAVEALAKAGEITPEQVKKWFANKRNRSKNSKSTIEIANMKRKRQFSARW